MLRVITLNLNGIRSAAKKGFFEWVLGQSPDIICVQEIKAQEADLNASFRPEGYYSYFHCAEKKGYSGVGIYTKIQPLNVVAGLGWPHADNEGRYIEVQYDRWVVASLYMPSGTMGPARQAIKYDFLERFKNHLQDIRAKGKEYIICGDWNIAHRQIDLKNWRSNQKNSGFLPEERAFMDELLSGLEFVDAFRVINSESEQYTWWSNRGQAWAKNVGWRIDYQIVTPGLKQYVKACSIYKEQRFSDHAPLIVDYSWPYFA